MTRPIAPRRLGLIVAGALLALPLAVTAQDEPASPAPTAGVAASPAPVVTSPEGAWQVRAFDPWAEGLIAPAAEDGLRLRLLGGGDLQGADGCGRFVGGYSLEGEQLWLGLAPTGNLDCGEADTLEAVGFSAALDTVASWRAGDDGSLELLDELGAVRVVLMPEAEVDPTGAWSVTSYARANGNLVEPEPEVPMTVLLEPGGRISGSTGCRLYEGEYQRQGESIVIGPVETVGLPCEQPQRRQERRLLAAFAEAYHWLLDGDVLTLRDAFDQPLLVLRAAPDEAAPAGEPAP